MIGRDIRNMADEVAMADVGVSMEDSGISILTSDIENRVAFAESITMGKTIFEWAPSSLASLEIENLTKEILSYVKEDVQYSAETQDHSTVA